MTFTFDNLTPAATASFPVIIRLDDCTEGLKNDGIIVVNGKGGNLKEAGKYRVASVDAITPQTTIVEKLAEMVANGELNSKFIEVESSPR